MRSDEETIVDVEFDTPNSWNCWACNWYSRFNGEHAARDAERSAREHCDSGQHRRRVEVLGRLAAAEAARDRALAERDKARDICVSWMERYNDAVEHERAARSRIADLEATAERVRALAVEAESVGGPGSSFVLAALESDVALATVRIESGGEG